MLNIVRMDLFRLLRSKSFYIIMILLVFTILWWVSSTSGDLNTGNINRVSCKPRTSWSVKDNPVLGILDLDPGLLLTEKGDVTLVPMVSYLLNSFIIRIFPVIFIVLFISGDNSSGFIKNIVSCVKRRRVIIFSKIITMSFFVFLEFFVLLIVTELASKHFLENYAHEITLEQLKYIGAQFLLYNAYTTIIILVTYALKNAAISLLVNLCLCFNIATIIIDILFSRIGISELSNLTVVHNMRMLSINAPLEIYIRAILVSITAILVYSILNSVLIEKRDL